MAARAKEAADAATDLMGDKYPVKMIPMTELRYASEAPPELGYSVRKVDPDQQTELEASIRAVGLVYPLVIKAHDGILYTIAGNRRLLALRSIHSDAPDTCVPTVDATNFKGTVPDIALASNEFVAMHPVDRYEAINDMVEKGATPFDVCQRFVLSERQFKQIMALGGLHEKVRAAWRADEIDSKCAMAFTLAPSVKEQGKVFDKLAKANEKEGNDPEDGVMLDWQVRDELAVGKEREAYKLVRFVGIDVYEKAGGKLNRDLFENQHDVLHPAIAKKLADAQLAAECQRLIDTGWAWAQPFSALPSEAKYSWRKVVPEKWTVSAEHQTRMDDLAAFLEQEHSVFDLEAVEKAAADLAGLRYEAAQATFDTKQRAKMGCGLAIDDHGTLAVTFGIVKPGEKPPASAKASGEDSGKAKTKPAAKPGDVSNALAQRLSEQLTAAASQTLAEDPKLALAALIAGFGTHNTNKVVSVSERGLASKRAVKQAKPLEFSAHLLEWIDASPAEKADALAGIAGAALDFQVHDAAHDPLKNKAVAALLDNMNGKTLNAAIRKAFDAKDYFESVNKELCLLAIREACGDEQADSLKGSKAEIEAFAVKNVGKSGWLPAQLRTIHYDGPPKKKSGKK